MIREQLIQDMKGYYASITAMDTNFGHHGIAGKGNGTFPLNMYEESIKVPAIFRHPGYIPQGGVSHALVSAYDFKPTLLDYLDLPNKDEEKLPGKSFKSLLLGQSMKERDDVVIYDEYGPVRMVRTKRWKYVHRYPYGPHELYNLENNPREEENRVEDPEIQHLVYDLRSRLEDWFHLYADSAIDGSRESVTGKGQLNRAGIYGRQGNQYYL